MGRTRRTAVAGGVAALTLAVTVPATLAATAGDDGVTLRGGWPGGRAELELEDRSVEPVICFVWEHDAPQDGDSIASRILTRDGVEVVDLGVGDQWIEGSASGCEIPHDERYRQVFADPAGHVVEFRVVEEQGTPVTPPLRSGPLARASG